jgi:signal transduction histidine kinase
VRWDWAVCSNIEKFQPPKKTYMSAQAIVDKNVRNVAVRLSLTFFASMLVLSALFQYSNVFKRTDEQNINRLFEARPWLKWSDASLRRLSLAALWQYHQQHEIPRSIWSWDYTLSWLIQNNHPPISQKIVIFNHSIEDEPPSAAIASHPWLKPLLSIPMRRSVYADWVTFLTKAGARAIVLDNEFPQYTDDDAQLAKAIFDAEHAVTGPKPVPVLFASTLNLRTQGNLVGELGSSSNGVLSELRKLDHQSQAKYSGLVGVILDDDQVVRRMAARMDSQFDTLDSIPLKILQQTGVTISRQPPDQFIIDFAGGANSELFPIRPLTYLLDPQKRQHLSLPQSADGDVSVRDAIVFIGDGVTDVFNTSTTNLGVMPMSGSELLANALDTISRGTWMTQVSGIELFAYLFLFALISTIFMGGIKALQLRLPNYNRKPLALWLADFLVFCGMMVLAIIFPAFVFAYCNTILPITSLVAATFISGILITLIERDFIREEAFREQLRNEQDKLTLARESHRNEMEAEAARANLREIEKDQERRREFAKRLNHDIRGPASSINWTLMRLKKEHFSQLVTEKMELIARNSQVLIDLVDELITSYVSNIPDKKSETINLNEIVKLCVLENQALAEEKDCRLIFQPSSADTTANINSAELSRAVTNLIRNAILHNTNKIEVIAGVEERAESFCIFVSDNGCGIPVDKREAIFEDGYSTGTAHTGLGLGIVRRIVQDAGASIEVVSAADQGVTFKVIFPRSFFANGQEYSAEAMIDTNQGKSDDNCPAATGDSAEKVSPRVAGDSRGQRLQ